MQVNNEKINENLSVRNCTLCEFSFTTLSSLRKHEQKCHENQTQGIQQEKEWKCPLCGYTNTSKDTIIDHFIHDHKISMLSQDIELKNNEFLKWKTDLERDTNAKYVIEYTSKSQKYTTKSYVCHHSKIGGFCPAGFKVNQDKETSRVHYIRTHVGHDSSNSVMPVDKKPIVCGECKIPFSKPANLRAHIQRKHPGKLDILCPKKTYAAVVFCCECSKTFVNQSNLRTHMKRAHKEREHQSRKIQCLKCVLCNFAAPKQNILAHYAQNHGISIDIESKEFLSIGEFENWKANVEAETVASFVSHHGSYSTKNSKKRVFECHRSGQFVSKSTGARQLKTQGSNKINGYCPAHIKVEMIDGKCKVKFCKTHIGHEQDLQHLFLTTAQRHEIAAKIAEKIPLSAILEEIKLSARENAKLERLHLVKKKDLYNIERCFQLHVSTVSQEHEECNNLSPHGAEDERTTFQVEEVAQSLDEGRSFDVLKQDLLKQDLLEQKKAAFSAGLLREINSITTLEELEILKRLIAPILPNLNIENFEKETEKSDMDSQNLERQDSSVNIQGVADTNGLITLFDKT